MATTTVDSPFTLAPPNAPSYRDFRTVADWASAIRGHYLDFTYGDDTGRMSVELAEDELGEDGLVLTPPNALRTEVMQVELTVPGANEPLFLDGHDCSALFWSESAVEKFLFPCFASAAADDASRFLGRLSDAWYGYPGRVVQVCALAYQYGVNAGLSQLSLESSVGLVCLERASNRLTLMGLNEFEQTYPLGAARGTGPAGPDSPLPPELKWLIGWQAERGVDSVLAREAAELVSGLRGHYVWFTLEDGTLTPRICPTEEPVLRPDNVVMHGVAVTVRPDRPAPSSVKVTVNECDEIHPIVCPGEHAVPDAMFWTDGAVEKLLLPYYASVKGRTTPYFTALLMGKWDGSIHPDCKPGEIDVVRPPEQLLPDTPGRAADDDGSTVYAITHLPRSEYVSDGSPASPASPALENRTRLLTVVAEGPGRDTWTFEEHPLLGGSTPGAGAAPCGAHRDAGGAAAGRAKRSRKRTSRAR
jgi:hypothetical protein